jgi:hypothetical protein
MSTPNTFGRTIQLFLVNGTPTGLRKATLHGWTGLVLVSGDATFGALTAREEVDRTGIYILSGPDPDTSGATRVYIGSGNSVAERIRQSAVKRDFWDTAITITTSDDDLSKGHAEYLEARVIELTAQAGRVILDNGTYPDTNRRRLPEADVANMEQFVANLTTILPVVGLDMLKPQPKAVLQREESSDGPVDDEPLFEISHASGVHAHAVEENGEFIVLVGSEARVNTGSVGQGYAGLKKELMDLGILVEYQDILRFMRPYSFKSPSAAAAVVLDRNANGRTEWKVKGTKQTYHDWQQAQAEQQEKPDGQT